MQGENQRYERERTFHNWVFSEKSRSSVWKFYTIADISEHYYRKSILARGAHDILEIGCGRGSVISSLGREVSFTAIDISEVAVQESADLARANGTGGTYLLMNAEETTFADQSFDLVCGTGILHHLNLNKACAEIRRILRPGGSAVFIEPLGFNPLINLYRKMTPRIRSADEHPFLKKDMDEIRSYFSQVEVRSFCLCSLAAVPFRKLKIFPVVKTSLERVDQFLFRAIPATGRYAWMVVLTLSTWGGQTQ